MREAAYLDTGMALLDLEGCHLLGKRETRIARPSVSMHSFKTVCTLAKRSSTANSTDRLPDLPRNAWNFKSQGLLKRRGVGLHSDYFRQSPFDQC